MDMLKKLDKKFLYICGALILVPILLVIFLMMFRGCSSTTTHDKYQDKMISAAKKYFKKIDGLPTEEGEENLVELETLVSEGYIKSADKLLEDTTCSGYVRVRNNGASVSKNNGGFHVYTPYLKCDEYKTNYLVDEIIKNVVNEGSGLYVTDNGYVFRGNKVNNYVTLGGKGYRIVSIDENNNIRLIRTEKETNSSIWDNKYNTEVNQNVGKNIYQDSKLVDNLNNIYNKDKRFNEEARKHLIAHSVCVGSRSQDDISFGSSECNQILEGQLVSLLNVSDFAKASTDPECTDIKTRSCYNYNYLADFMTETWTSVPVSENTYQVYYISAGSIYVSDANEYNDYYLVVYISGEELYSFGDGSSEDPYVIGK